MTNTRSRIAAALSGLLVVALSSTALAHHEPDHVRDTTTTTSRHETTTTVPPTTTTVPPSTTTTIPPTTTTTVVPFVLPPTEPFTPGEAFNDGGSFRLKIQCTPDPNNPDFVCPEVNGKPNYGDLDYFAHGMPYLYEDAIPGNHDHAWWTAGDRQGYACGYGFMYERHPSPPGHPEIQRPGVFLARATVVRPFEAGYGKVNDDYMEEGERYYDGTVANEGQEITSEDCQAVALDPDFDYASYVPTGPDEIRIGILTPGGEIADIRDFTNVLIDENVGHFEYIGFEDGRVSVVFILNGLVSHAIYYDEMNGGEIVVEVDGVIVAGP